MSGIRDKIAALLRKARDTGCTEQEAALFFAKATELSEKHAISLSEIEARDQIARDPVGMMRTAHGKNSATYLCQVALAAITETRVVYVGEKGSVCGLKSKCEQFNEWLSFLEETNEYSFQAFKRVQKRLGNRMNAGTRKQFNYGFALRFAAVMQEIIVAREAMIKAETEKMKAGRGMSGALVLVTQAKAAADHVVSQKFGNSVKTKTKKMPKDSAALRAGYDAGNVRPGSKQIEN